MRVILFALSLALGGCASTGVDAWQPSGAAGSLAPALAAPMEGVIAGLYADSGGEGDWLEVEELRVLALDDKPWVEVGPAEAKSHALLGLVVHRSCWRWNNLDYVKLDRSSWMIFENQALVAFDHGAILPGCLGERILQPAGEDRLEFERGLVRYTAQRYPSAWPTLEERLRGGLALVQVGRLDDAERVLKLGDTRVAELKDEIDATFDEEKTALQARYDEARKLRLELMRSLKTARDAEKAGDAL